LARLEFEKNSVFTVSQKHHTSILRRQSVATTNTSFDHAQMDRVEQARSPADISFNQRCRNSSNGNLQHSSS